MSSPFLSLLSLGALAASVVGSPLPVPEMPRLAPRAVSDFQCFNASLPNITIYATGGTIAGSAGSADQTTGYQAGALGIQALIDAVPQLCNVSNVRGVQIANVDSGDVNSTILTNLTHQIQADLDNPHTQGVVVTHGTDTLEESSFFLDLTIKSEKPVVIVGSMRPATALSADGPINLLSAVRLAGSKSAQNRGALIVLNDRIASARYTIKAHANSLDTFKAEDQGYLGAFENIHPVFWYPPVRPLGHHYFNISTHSVDKALPQVDVLYGHQEVDPELFQAAIDSGAKGIVLAGLGAGGWPTEAVENLEKVLKKTDVPVIVSRRTAWGFVEEKTYGIGAGYLNPAKSRIQLQLALEKGLSNEEIKEIFEYNNVA
ncbi:L-asparaginase [Fusarium albosuccineum]|uniref:asparaginase n=1 Tax=Fusarium albosuccineum TaxID=1237068 RepID=A0A8H4L8F3_9HYPO|nr:L-asparaginase [Fusarium albosuccineum]